MSYVDDAQLHDEAIVVSARLAELLLPEHPKEATAAIEKILAVSTDKGLRQRLQRQLKKHRSRFDPSTSSGQRRLTMVMAVLSDSRKTLMDSGKHALRCGGILGLSCWGRRTHLCSSTTGFLTPAG